MSIIQCSGLKMTAIIDIEIIYMIYITEIVKENITEITLDCNILPSFCHENVYSGAFR